MKDKVLAELKNVFKPEFLNRIDSTVVFRALEKDDVRKIVDLEMAKIIKSLNAKGISLQMTIEAKDWVGEKGYDPVFGARPLRRVIQDSIEDRLSEMLLAGDFGAGDTVLVDRKLKEEGDGLEMRTLRDVTPAVEPEREPAGVA